MERFSGWIFDVYPCPGGMRLWALDGDGRARSLLDPWRSSFYLDGPPAALEAARKLEGAAGASSRPVERREFFSNEARLVREVRVEPLRHRDLVRGLGEIRGLELFNADFPLPQAYHYELGHFPLAFGEFEVEGERLLAFALRDSPWALDYALPPLRFAHLGMDASADPNHRRRGGLVLTLGRKGEGTSYLLEEEDGDLAEAVSRHVERWDPDVILSDWGDSYILPRLALLAARTGTALRLSREPGRGMAGRGSRSFYTYGRTVYQNMSRTLFGRWHLDSDNSFMLRETGLEGLLEIARVAKIPVQRAARTTIGTSLSSMQLDVAVKNGYLVPVRKAQAEDFRGALELVVADKGGLVYEPELGWHENVAELDFVSMYPTLMVQKNISPETVNCACCASLPEARAPEIGHHLCRRRPGLVPQVLAPILDKRFLYKQRAKDPSVPAERRAAYKARATAHKWTLVCCFGYLGFRNARFGKIEAHECVTAWGRETLLRAKETAEAAGWRLLHANVDSLWVQRDGLGPESVERLRLTIEQATGCPVGLEGIYRWIRYCPSCMDPLSGVPNRYFGAFSDGELKIRGLALRRHDTTAFVRAMQNEMLALLSKARGLSDCRALKAALEDIREAYRLRLKEGEVTPEELAIPLRLSKEPQDYVHDTLSSIAARQLAGSGVKLHPGEEVRYIIVDAKEKVKDWRVKPLALLDGNFTYDPAKYGELVDRAAAEILEGL